ncbi:NifB/NifX family molybdenum-iron cluster-binding protein [Oceanospirillum sediminis]|uniref:Dinitrogenase iron-molybdenum cofactor biosynthesis protein n=1 Tax=Oceanospirillum sediminis TaxID=2760088 RepID=A0A839IMN6_9GAMM|nr:NifB/NifX family molybdenum-iron cluster-binding protein [Oceanospirillum sediminis]MBB1486475.1 dinitrogenase iron-molybdenum cofactor biosynthesis protein [Oceanospirillum sediminis]
MSVSSKTKPVSSKKDCTCDGDCQCQDDCKCNGKGDGALPEKESMISKVAAQRLSQAARALSSDDPEVFVIATGAYLGLPIDETQLQALTVEDINRIVSGDDGQLPEDYRPEAIKLALSYLWGEQSGQQAPPQIDPEPEVMAGLPYLQIAVASNNGTQLDGHFGSCLRFLIYRLNKEGIYLADIQDSHEVPSGLEKNEARVKLLEGCQLLYVQSIGGPAAAKVVRGGIHPVKVPVPGEAMATLNLLQSRLDNPPPWLGKILGQQSSIEKRFSAEKAEELVTDDQ